VGYEYVKKKREIDTILSIDINNIKLFIVYRYYVGCVGVVVIVVEVVVVV